MLNNKCGCGKYLYTRPLEHPLGGGSENCGERELCRDCKQKKQLNELKEKINSGDGSPRTVYKESVLTWIDEIFPEYAKKKRRFNERKNKDIQKNTRIRRGNTDNRAS